MKDYDQNEEWLNPKYLDVNNLYGRAVITKVACK